MRQSVSASLSPYANGVKQHSPGLKPSIALAIDAATLGTRTEYTTALHPVFGGFAAKNWVGGEIWDGNQPRVAVCFATLTLGYVVQRRWRIDQIIGQKLLRNIPCQPRRLHSSGHASILLCTDTKAQAPIKRYRAWSERGDRPWNADLVGDLR